MSDSFVEEKMVSIHPNHKKFRTPKYIEYSKLKKKYPRDRSSPTSSGSQGDVYKSGSYAVKMFKGDPELGLVAIELNIYSSIKHPCIMRPICWSVSDEGVGYLVMPFGENIITAYKNKKIRLSEILSDLLSAIAFLNSIGIAHCDIKPGNIIFYDGKAKLIDMGIARRTHLYQDGQYYITEMAYTPPYMDPEYSHRQQNNINCEVYAIAVTIAEIWDTETYLFCNIYELIEGVPESEFKNFLIEGISYADVRPNSMELLRESPLIVRRYTGTDYSGSLEITQHNPDKDVVRMIIDLCYFYNFSCETLFLALKIAQRSYSILLADKKQLEFYLIALSDLANNITGAERLVIQDYINTNEWATEIPLEEFSDLFRKMKIKILVELRGIVLTDTYWDHAESSEDLMALLQMIVSSESIDNFRPKSGHNKCIMVRELLTKEQAKRLPELKEGEVKPSKKKLRATRPCSLEISPDLDLVTEIFASKKWKELPETDFVSLLIHNRSVLVNLDLDIALDIFNSLVKGFRDEDHKHYKDVRYYTLDRICNYKWRNYSDRISDERLHPFNTTWLE